MFPKARVSILLGSVASLVGAGTAGAQNCQPTYGFQTSIDPPPSVLTSYAVDGGQINSAAVAQAASWWNNSCYEGDAPLVPEFSTSGSGTPVSIVFWGGANDGVRVPNCGAECGCVTDWSAQGTPPGGTINLLESNYVGQSCGSKIPNLVAHELGHILGLANAPASCYPAIMAFVTSASYPSSNDCEAVDFFWYTGTERERDSPSGSGGGADPGFPPPPGPGETPIVVDLGGRGYQMSGLSDGVWFDLDGYGSFLVVWIDENHDGETQEGELKGLKELGIEAVSLAYTESRRRDRYGNQLRYSALLELTRGVGHSSDIVLVQE